jgi:hypothetical protein
VIRENGVESEMLQEEEVVISSMIRSLENRAMSSYGLTEPMKEGRLQNNDLL